MKFKIEVSKWSSKHTVVMSAASEKEAREKIHAQGYSILSVANFEEENIEGKNAFYFDIEQKGKRKTGKIVATDIFKTYVKLRHDLDYRVHFLYHEWDDEDTKKRIIRDLEWEYGIYMSSKINQKVFEKEDEKNTQSKKEDEKIDNFHLKKELDEVYKLIDFVLSRLQNIIQNRKDFGIDEIQQEKLKRIFNNILKIKKSTNIVKLKEVWEIALLKIWKLELWVLELKKDETSKNLLKETNAALKKIGSKEQFIERDKDIKRIVGDFFSGLQKQIKRKKKKKKQIVDRHSHGYIKTLLLLKKYKDKQKENRKRKAKHIFAYIFPFGKNLETKEEISIREKVIKQNISILTAKINGSSFSYTKTLKKTKAFFAKIIHYQELFKKYIYIAILLYALSFIALLLGTQYGFVTEYIRFSYIWLSGVIFTLFFLALFHVKKDITSIIFSLLSVAILAFILIFGLINF